MQLGIFAKTFVGSDPLTVMTAVRAAGFECTQYNMACSGLASMPDVIEPKVASCIKAASRDAGVGIAAVSGTYNMIHPDVGVRALGLARLEVLASRCAAMGTGVITLCSGTRDALDQWRWHKDNETPAAWADLCEAMAAAVEIAERHDIVLGIEPELANVVNSAAKARELISTIQSSRLKIVFDPANLFEVATLLEQRRIVSEALGLLGEHIVMGHAKDRNAEGEFVAAGKGVLDYAHYFRCLKSTGFDGPMIAHGLAAHEAVDVYTFLKGALSHD